jgi:hypothetical protein
MNGDTSISGKKIVEESLAEASGWGGSSGWTKKPSKHHVNSCKKLCLKFFRKCKQRYGFLHFVLYLEIKKQNFIFP